MATLTLLSSPSGDGSLLTGTPWGGVALVIHSGATTLGAGDVGKVHACTVSGAYTLTLPIAANVANKTLTVVVTAASTQLLTLAGAGTDTIDGQATRLMWAGESAILYSNGSTWTKVGGRSIPMACRMQQIGAQAVASGIYTKVTLDRTAIDNTGLMADLANSQVLIRRAGPYQISGFSLYAAFPGGAFSVEVAVNGSGTNQLSMNSAPTSAQTYPANNIAFLQIQAAGDILTLNTSQFTGTTQNLVSGGGGCDMMVLEAPVW